MLLTLVLITIGAAIIFDFLNGFHDAANAIATVVVTRTLTPVQAVIMAGFANFIGYFFFSHAIAKTVGKGIINVSSVSVPLILAALLGAIFWNLATWLLGLPTSSSHALMGGLVGSAVAAVGFKAVIFSGVFRIIIFIFVAPLLGFAGAIFFTSIVMFLSRKSSPKKANHLFRYLQLVSAGFYSISHGTNDAQKTMGVIVMTLFSAGFISTFDIPNWVVLICYTSIGLGTMFGGWRIVKTMGTGISKIRAMEGFCAETASAIVLIGTAMAGIPVSTTHVISGSIMGVGSAEYVGKVRWTVARKILWAWIITVPFTAISAAAVYYLFEAIRVLI